MMSATTRRTVDCGGARSGTDSHAAPAEAESPTGNGDPEPAGRALALWALCYRTKNEG